MERTSRFHGCLGIGTQVLAALLACAAAAAQNVTSLTLIDADADVPIAAFDPLLDGAVLDLATLPTRNLNVRANVDGLVGSIRFDYDGVVGAQIENVAPYAFRGDVTGDYNPWTPTLGAHDLTATPFVGADATGGPSGAAVAIAFTVVDGSGNTPPTADAGADASLLLPASSIVLNGAGSDVDGTVDGYLWNQVAGATATLAGADTDTLTVSGLVAGLYGFQLTVTDDDGDTGSDAATVLVSAGGVVVSGELRKWHTVTLTFDGPLGSESGATNPFLEYRMIVTFDHAGSGQSVQVPGYFATDGLAAETSAADGTRWRAQFTPSREGDWTFTASFRTGADIAVDPDPTAGVATGFDGLGGSFVIGPSDKTGRDFRAHGQLRYTAERYLRFAETGAPFLKGGADSPENFLGYAEFDNTTDNGGANNDLVNGVHHYLPHVADWTTADPSWQNGKGHGIIGAINYLSSKGMNSVYFLTMNVTGDGREVFPWTTYNSDFTRFDASKLDQWEVVFAHMERMGVQMHVLLQETENDQLLNGGNLGLDRQLYYRELIARFGHHLAIEWNLGEETSRTQAQHEADSQYIKGLDEYDHPIVLHTYPGEQEARYAPMLGWPYLDGPSIQIDGNTNSHARTIEWIDRSAAAGHPWVTCIDEQNSAGAGVVPDADDFDHDEMRKEVLWGNLIGGGAGVEWYFGYSFPHSDLDCEDWRSRDHMWELTDIAIDFFHQHLPFTSMASADALVGSGWCLAKPGEVYAIYLKNGGTTTLDLSTAAGAFSLRWFDPRSGGNLRIGSVDVVSGGAIVAIGDPPSNPGDDWVALLRPMSSLYRGTVALLGPGWKGTALPLTSVNDDETSPFPIAAASPALALDAIPTAVPLTLYRVLGPRDSATDDVLTAAKDPGGVTIRF